MTQEEILKNNILIASFLGYKYHKKVLVDFSDCGGLYDLTDVFSEVPIETNDYHEEGSCNIDSYFKEGFPGKDWHRVIYNPDYMSDWNLLFPVLERIEALGYRWEIGNAPTYQQYRFHYCKIHPLASIEGISLLDAVYGAVITFITWFNNQNKKV